MPEQTSEQQVEEAAQAWLHDGQMGWLAAAYLETLAEVRRLTAENENLQRHLDRLAVVTSRMRKQVFDAGSISRIHEEDVLEAARIVDALSRSDQENG